MGNDNVVTTLGRKICLNRTFKNVPDYTSPQLFKVGTGTTTPVIGDTDAETAVGITTLTTYTKAVVTGYPSVDETTFNATTRSLLLTTDANGNSLTEFGLFNNDATPKMFSHVVYTAITKTTSVQVVFVEKDLVTLG